YPMEHGIVSNWDDMEKIWHHMFYNELRIGPEEHPHLFTEVPLNPESNRERMVQVLMETFAVPAVYIAIPAMLAIMAAGRVSGLAIDTGDGVSHAAALFDGRVLPHAIYRSDVGGRDIDDFLMNLLTVRGPHKFYSTAERDNIRELKEK